MIDTEWIAALRAARHAWTDSQRAYLDSLGEATLAYPPPAARAADATRRVARQRYAELLSRFEHWLDESPLP